MIVFDNAHLNFVYPFLSTNENVSYYNADIGRLWHWNLIGHCVHLRTAVSELSRSSQLAFEAFQSIKTFQYRFEMTIIIV